MDYAENSRISSAVSEPSEGAWIPSWKKIDSQEFRERACHSSFIIGNSLLSFGGWNGAAYFNDVVALNLTTMKPQKVTITGDKMTSRYTHSANVFQGDKVIVVGGFSGRSGVIDEISVLSVVSKKPLSLVWNVIGDDHREKLYRSDHTANIYGNYLYLFGGADKKEESTNELWYLNLTKSQIHPKQYTWTKLTPSGLSPRDRYGHSSALYNETLYIFGGTSTKSKHLLNDLWMINLRELKWQQISTSDAPSPRTATSMQEVDGKLIIFGGTSTFSSNELFSFDLKTQVWKRIETTGDLPQGRAFHTCTYRQNKLIIWGGEIGHNKCTHTIFTLDLKGPSQLSALNGLDNQSLREKKALNMIERISQDDIFTDVVFEVEDQEIRAHRVVLAKACQHFYDLFTQGIVKQQTTIIKVPDAKAATFKTFLKYIYCGEIELQYSMAIDLLGLANEYSYDDLKELCESYLSKVLTKENVLELSNVAEGFEAENLKNNILKFHQNNP